MARRMVPLILVLSLSATACAAESRLGSLGRNDTVVTREEDPVALDALADEAAARVAKDDALQQSVSVLTDAVDALEARPVADPSLPSRVATVESLASAAASTASEASDEAELAKNTADAAKTAADAAKATADSAKTTASTAKTVADAANETADAAKASATEAVASAANAETVAAGAVATANAAAPAATVSALTSRVVALEERPVTDTTLAARVDAVEESVETVSADVDDVAAIAAAASSDAQTALATANRAAATADAAHAAADSTLSTAQTALARADSAKTAATEAAAAAAAAETLASSASATAAAAAPASTVSALANRVAALESAEPSGGISATELAVEVSARISGDADLSARIDALDAAKAEKTALNTLTSRVDDVTADASEAQAAASNAAAAAATATTAATAAHAAANAAADTANQAVTKATAAETTAAEALALREMAETASQNAEDALTAAETARQDAASAQSAVRLLDSELADEVALNQSRQKFAVTRYNVTDVSTKDVTNNSWNKYAHRVTTTPLYFDKNTVGNYAAPLKIALGNGLTLTTETSEYAYWGAKIEVKESVLTEVENASARIDEHDEVLTSLEPVALTGWVSPKDWTLTVSPGEEVVAVDAVSTVVTNALGQVRGLTTETVTTSASKVVAVTPLEKVFDGTIVPCKTDQTWTCDGATVTATATAWENVATVSAATEGLYRVVAYSAGDGRTRDAWIQLRAKTKVSEIDAYLEDTEAYRKAANDAVLAALNARDTSSTVASGVTAAVAVDDAYITERFGTWRTDAPLAPKFFAMMDPRNYWGPEPVVVAPNFAVTAAHWNPPQQKIFRLDALDGSGELGFYRTTLGVALAEWAKENGYSDEEIRLANIADLWVWKFSPYTGYGDPAVAVPDEIIPFVIDPAGVDYYYGGSLSGIACYSPTQNGYLSYAVLGNDYGSWWTAFGRTPGVAAGRADIVAALSPPLCAQVYGGDSGRPILMIHDNSPVILSVFWSAGGGASLVTGADILDDFISKNSNGAQSLKRITAPVTTSEE